MNKIYIYKAEVLKKHEQLQDKVVNYVKLTRPEGLEEHWPKAGDIVNLYLPDDIFYFKRKIMSEGNNGIYVISLEPVNVLKYNVKIENLKDEGLECLLHLPQYINDEVKGLSKLTKIDADLNKSLMLYFDISKNLLFDYENLDEVIKTDVIRAIKNAIKDNDFYVDTDNYGTIEVYTNEPLIEEVIDRYTDGERLKFKGIIEEETKVYRLIIRTNIYKKVE